MSSTTPPLATLERRVIATAFDGALLLISALFVIATIGPDTEDFVVTLLCFYIAYQALATVKPEISLGRTAADIVVISIGDKSRPNLIQALLRPLSRSAMLYTAFELSVNHSVEWLIAIPIAIELLLISHSTLRQSIADRISGCIVVRRPPLQPHRAPAFPMYSAKDEEFGPKP